VHHDVEKYNTPLFFNRGSVVPQHLRVLLMASMGATEPNRETGIKRHLWPFRCLDAFSGLIACPKCICSEGSAPIPAVGAYSAPPDLLTGAAAPSQESLPHSWPSASIFGPHECLQDKFLAMPMGSVSNQNSC